jgi:hypothetical protein
LEQITYYGSLAVAVLIILFGLYLGFRSFRVGRKGEYSTTRNLKSSLLFSAFIAFTTLGFMLIVMITDRTRISDYLAAFLILELIFGAVIFLGAFISQWLWMKFRTYLSHGKK